MSSQRIRAPRGGARGGMNNTGEEGTIWRECQSDIDKLAEGEKRAKELKAMIFSMEERMVEEMSAGKKSSIDDVDKLAAYYREQVKMADNMTSRIGSDTSNGLLQNIAILKAVVSSNEEREETTISRGSTSRDPHSRSTNEFDVPSDSPGPSPAENRQVRKLGGGPRTSSQPPKNNVEIVIRTEGPPEPSERSTSKPKITYAIGDDVAFRRKTGDGDDWIQGIVTRVIGEGKSRRYEVKDPYPDLGTAVDSTLYKSSASQMVPIPTTGARLEDYEVGKRVLALYPQTTTFYGADVKRMLEGGKKVEVLFEEEAEEKVVDRRFVLDHKGF